MRQYIGARYVPKVFNNNGSSEWVKNFAYEALTIVTYNNASYISALEVPANTEITNTKYWIKTGSGNEMIGSLQAQIDSIMLTISSINENYNKRMKLTNRCFILIGDSYGVGYTPDGDVNPWINILGAYITEEGGKYESNAVGGIGWIGGSETTFETLIINFNPKSFSKNQVTDIIVAGGYNDLSKNSTDVLNVIKRTVSNIKNIFPNANLSYYCCGFSISSGNNRRLISEQANYIGYNVEKFNFKQKSNLILHNKGLFSSDGFHPNQKGQQIIANKIFEDIKTGDFTISQSYRQGEANITLNEQTLSIGAISFKTTPSRLGKLTPITLMTSQQLGDLYCPTNASYRELVSLNVNNGAKFTYGVLIYDFNGISCYPLETIENVTSVSIVGDFGFIMLPSSLF